MFKALSSVMLIAVALIVTGCSNRLGQFTVASSQNVRGLDYSIEDKSKTTVQGESCIHRFFFIPIGHFDARIQRAMDDAIANGHANGVDGDMLVNVRIDNTAWWAILYGQDCMNVSGDLVKVKKS